MKYNNGLLQILVVIAIILAILYLVNNLSIRKETTIIRNRGRDRDLNRDRDWNRDRNWDRNRDRDVERSGTGGYVRIV